MSDAIDLEEIDDLLKGLALDIPDELTDVGDRRRFKIFFEESTLDEVWIKDRPSEIVVRQAVKKIAGPQGAWLRKIVACLVFDGDPEGPDYLRTLLSLGLNVDEPVGGRRLSHYCASLECAKILGACRPDAVARIHDKCVPAEYADRLRHVSDKEKRAEFEKMLRMWEDLDENGFHSIAQLACEKKFWAVRNLTRLGKVDLREYRTKYRGHNVFEWTDYHVECDQLEELEYLYGLLLSAEEGKSDSDDSSGSVDEKDHVCRFHAIPVPAAGASRGAGKRTRIKSDASSRGAEKRRRIGSDCAGSTANGSTAAEKSGDSILLAADALYKDVRRKAMTTGRQCELLDALKSVSEQFDE